MSLTTIYSWFVALPATILHPLRTGLALVVRLWVGWQFLQSGWLKLNSWETTLFLFQEEYHVPFVSSKFAAVAGTGGELLFPILLGLGLFGRLSAVGLSAVNIMAVYAYAHVLFGEGFEAALGQHVLWGFMLLVIVIYGPGKASLDEWLSRKFMKTEARAPAKFHAAHT